jgi:hypothetical protein
MTMVVINKSLGDLKTNLSLQNFSAAGAAKRYQYSSADLTQIVALADLAVTAPVQGSMTSVISNVTFPAMSITIVAIPKN